MLQSVFKGGDQDLILGEVVGLVAKVFGEMGDFVSGLILDYYAIAGGGGVAAGSAVAVGDEVVGGRGFAGCRVTIGGKRLSSGAMRHSPSLQRMIVRAGLRRCRKILKHRGTEVHRVIFVGDSKSAAGGQAGGEARRQICGEDAILRRFQVVGRAVKVDDLRFGIEQGVGGAPISVARLTDRAGIDQVTSLRLQLQRDRLGLSDGTGFRTETVGTGTVGEESALQMGMAEEGKGDGERKQWDESIAD